MRVKVQIRPAIYGDKGLLYECYKVEDKFSLWLGSRREYEQIHWRISESGEAHLIDDFTYWSNSDLSSHMRTCESLSDAIKVVKQCYGNSVQFIPWRPEQ